MSVALWSGSALQWERDLSALKSRLAPVFGRREVGASAGAFIDGLLSGISRKTGWLMAEQAGLDRAYRMQSLLGRSSWNADVLRDLVRAEVIGSLGDPRGVLVVDETGFLKKGTHSVGVARQYSGTAGRVENCQVGVFLGYASPLGQALIDRRLYLPDAWAADEARRRQVRVPEPVTFATKPQIACDLIAAALDTGAPCAWVLADALYGSDSRLRRMLEARRQPYVLAVRSNHTLRMLTATGLLQTDPAQLAGALPGTAWAAHAAGEGSKGPRLYEWARIALPWTVDEGFERWLLIRRSRRDGQDLAYYLVFAPAGTDLAELAGAAGLRWIEEQFSARKGRARARPLRGPLLAWLAPAHDPVHGSARLSRRAFRPAAPHSGKQTERKESACRRRMSIATVPPPSVPEIRYLIARLLFAPINTIRFIRAWSSWRRRHQAAAARAHNRTR